MKWQYGDIGRIRHVNNSIYENTTTTGRIQWLWCFFQLTGGTTEPIHQDCPYRHSSHHHYSLVESAAEAEGEQSPLQEDVDC